MRAFQRQLCHGLEWYKWCHALPLMQAQGKKWSDAQVYGTRTILEAVKLGGLQALMDGNVADSVRSWSHRQPYH